MDASTLPKQKENIMKQCTKCKKEKSFSDFHKKRNGLSSRCKDCAKIYKQQWRQTHKVERAEYQKKYRKTLVGYLGVRFYAMQQRCNNPNDLRYVDYGGRGIKCLFESSADFINYVVNTLKINIEGLQIHRINNDGNYEIGNIEFLTKEEHLKKHNHCVLKGL